MRIAFDLDGTLVPLTGGTERVRAFPLSWWFRERLRAGSTSLLCELRSQGHEVWVYTTSLRSPRYVRAWFRALGVRLDGVVNKTIHDAALANARDDVRALAKYPPAFGIDLLVDDLPGIGADGRRHGFGVVVVAGEDDDWANRVMRAVTQAIS